MSTFTPATAAAAARSGHVARKNSNELEQAQKLQKLASETAMAMTPRNRLLSWYVGGLNYQIEHHLFPKVCSVHYPAISRVVRLAAAAHGVPYHEQPTLLRAIRSHYRMLKHFGRDAGSDVNSPNTYG